MLARVFLGQQPHIRRRATRLGLSIPHVDPLLDLREHRVTESLR
jgi:hypothetical protein